MTPEQMDDALLRAIAAARRGPMAKPSKTDRRILEGATRDARLRAAPLDAEPVERGEEES